MASNEAFYRKNVKTGKYKQYIVERVDDDFGVVSYSIATVYLKDIDFDNLRCELCIFTSDDEEWNSENQKMSIDLLLDVAFDDLHMHKVYTYVFRKNMDEIDLFLKSGFILEATLVNEAKNLKGEYEDIIRMSLINKKCK